MACTMPLPAPTMGAGAPVPLAVSPRSLAAAFTRVPDPRRAARVTYPLAAVLSLVVVAILADHLSVLAIAQWADRGADLLRQPGPVARRDLRGRRPPAYHAPVAQPRTAWQYREEAAFFVRALRTGEPFLSSGEDTLTDIRLYEEIYRRHFGIE